MGKITTRKKKGDQAVFYYGARLPVRHRLVLDVYFSWTLAGPATSQDKHSVPHGKLVACKSYI